MDSFRSFLRSDNFWARAFTFGMILAFFRASLALGKIYTKSETLQDLKFFGIVGILIGAYVGHQLYYKWIFPEKNKTKRR